MDEPGEELIIDENIMEFNGNIFHDLVAGDILDPDINQNNPNMEGDRQGAGQQVSQRMVVVNHMRHFPKFLGEKTESADNHYAAFDDYLEIQHINVVDANVAKLIIRLGYSLLSKTRKRFNQGREGRPHAKVTDWNALKRQFKQQFHPVSNTREEQMASWRNIKWGGNETLDESSHRLPN